MAQLSFNIEDASMPEVLDALAAHFGYRDMVMVSGSRTPVPNPETKPAFVRRQLIQWIKGRVLAYRKETVPPATDVVIT